MEALAEHVGNFGVSNQLLADLVHGLLRRSGEPVGGPDAGAPEGAAAPGPPSPKPLPRFLGVRSWLELDRDKEAFERLVGDRLAGGKTKRRANRTMILNVGAHFVTVVVGPDSVKYLDTLKMPLPYGGSDYSRRDRFLRRFIATVTGGGKRKGTKKRRLNVLRKRIQAADSNFCGLYAALFSVWYLLPPGGKQRDMIAGNGNGGDLSFITDASKLEDNDRKCVAYLKRFAAV